MKTTLRILMALLLLTACYGGSTTKDGTKGDDDATPTSANLLSAAEKGDCEAQLRLALAYDAGRQGYERNAAEAARWYRAAARQGVAEAQNNLGVLYKDGDGLRQDYGEAARWFTMAARQGNILAQSNLGWLYQAGKGVAQDYDSARHWYLEAARHGHPAAQNNLATMYRDGQGVARSLDSARYWFEQAARKGMKLAQRNLQKLDSMTHEH